MTHGPWGKPRLVDAVGVDFNLAHSGGLAAYAFGRDRQVGIDVERIRLTLNAKTLADRYFTPSEAQAIGQTSEGERTALFFTYWVRKEAVLKAIGYGLRMSLSAVEVAGDQRHGRGVVVRLPAGTSANWQIADLPAGEDTRAAVAVDRPPRCRRAARYHQRSRSAIVDGPRTHRSLRRDIAHMMDRTIGRTISHYTILDRIGAGGMGVVYKALDSKLDRVVAVKFLPPHLGHDVTARARFIAEAKAASALDHPNIATIFEIDEGPDVGLFIVMAYYPGQSLSERIQKGPLPLPVALDFAVQIGEGLAEAHEHDIVHRDVKPGNIMVTDDGIIKILDFGLGEGSRKGVGDPGLVLGTLEVHVAGAIRVWPGRPPLRHLGARRRALQHDYGSVPVRLHRHEGTDVPD